MTVCLACADPYDSSSRICQLDTIGGMVNIEPLAVLALGFELLVRDTCQIRNRLPTQA